MSFPVFHAATSASGLSRTGVELAHELSALVDEIQRTRDWFNSQIEAQLSSLQQLKATMQASAAPSRAPVATLFEAPHPVVTAEPLPPPPAPPLTAPGQFQMGAFAPTTVGAFPTASTSMPPPPVVPFHQAVVLPPAHVTTLDPELEQATLRELNDALAKAFAEIAARGGMIT